MEKIIYTNDGGEPIMELYSDEVEIDTPVGTFYERDSNKINPEVQMLYLADLKEGKYKSLI